MQVKLTQFAKQVDCHSLKSAYQQPKSTADIKKKSYLQTNATIRGGWVADYIALSP